MASASLLQTGLNCQFIIVAPPYRHSSAGTRALHRLCHLLNTVGCRAAIKLLNGAYLQAGANPKWNTPVFAGPTAPADAIVIYPEVVQGNPLCAERVVRWALNYPGLLGGDREYTDSEVVFVWDARMLDRVRPATRRELSLGNVLTIPVIDPAYIYADPAVRKEFDSYFIHKGRNVRTRYRLPCESQMICVDLSTPSYWHLGELLRKTKRLYLYDHASILAREALVCGCEILQVHADGVILDPRICSRERRRCSFQETSSWPANDYLTSYKDDWDNPAPVLRFVDTVTRYWMS